MSAVQMLITISAIAAGTALTRFLPFIIFPSGRETPAYIKRLQGQLPCAVIGLLVVYCLREVELTRGSHGIPEILAILSIVILHGVKKNMLLSIAGGTAVYMLLMQTVFV